MKKLLYFYKCIFQQSQNNILNKTVDILFYILYKNIYVYNIINI